MKNTPEEKEKFFVQYYGQSVYRHRTWTKEKNWIVNSNVLDRYSLTSGYLELTPLSLITDEDKIEVAKILNRNGLIDICSNDSILMLHKKNAISFVNQENKLYRSFEDISFVNDYLRSKGYALPYNGISVEEQIEFGWTVLKTK
jgi:hypothetical protein